MDGLSSTMIRQTACSSTINASFAKAVHNSPESVFLDFMGDVYSYARMNVEVDRFARGLHKLGVGPGDRVVSVLNNCPDGVIAWFATNRLGAIHVPINSAYKGEYLRHQIGDSGARVVICEIDYLTDVVEATQGLLSVEHIAHTAAVSQPPSWHGTISSIDDHRVSEGYLPDVSVAPADLAAILYTSGTTGLSKGCMVSHNYLYDVSRRYGEMIGRNSDDIVLTPMPLFHITGIAVVLSTIEFGGSSAIGRKFSVSNFWPDVKRSNATMVVLLGSLVLMIANAPNTPETASCFGQVRAVIGVPMSRQLASVWRERFGVERASGSLYGSTECGQVLDARFDVAVPDGCCGRLNDTFDVKIVDEHDEEVPQGEIGEIVVRPKRRNVMFSGYWNNAEATSKVSRNLWHHMGDNGRVDEHGNFFFVDRSKDVIRRRGENISSFELETTFLKHPHIAEVAIHAVPSELLEDDVKATIVLQADAVAKESDILEWARPLLPKFALPRYVEFRPELPKNASGRVLKFQLREEGATDTTWDRDRT